MTANKCPQCGAPVDAGAASCKYCGEAIASASAPPPQFHGSPQAYASPLQQQDGVGSRSRVAIGLVAILTSFFGFNVGIYNFMLGFTGKGVLQLLLWIGGWATVWLVIGFIPLFIVWIWGVIEGIIILTNKNFRDADGNLLKG